MEVMNLQLIRAVTDKSDLTLCQWMDSKFESHSVPSVSKRKRENSEINSQFDAVLVGASNKRKTLDGTGDVLLDLKPRWRRAYVKNIKHDGRNKATEARNDHRPPELCRRSDECDETSGSQCFDDVAPSTPTFRSLAMSPCAGDHSPASVVCETNYHDNFYLYQRSLAWSDEDESDEECNHESDEEGNNSICNERQCEAPRNRNMGLEDSNNQISQRELETWSYYRQNHSKQKNHLPYHGIVSLDKLHALDPHTSEIFWEEKVLDDSDLERMAKLSV